MTQLYSWQEYKAEVEFLQANNDGVIPIEVKSGKNTRAKILEKICQKYRPHYAIILSANNTFLDKQRNVMYFPLYLAGLQPWLRNIYSSKVRSFISFLFSPDVCWGGL